MTKDTTQTSEEITEEKKPFMCPNCKEISRDDVLFLCNTCDSSEILHKDDMYICPSCLEPGENFQCSICGSKKVEYIEESDSSN